MLTNQKNERLNEIIKQCVKATIEIKIVLFYLEALIDEKILKYKCFVWVWPVTQLNALALSFPDTSLLMFFICFVRSNN